MESAKINSRTVFQVENERVRECVVVVGVGVLDQAAQILLRATDHSQTY